MLLILWKRSTALWMPGRDHKQPALTGGQESKNIPNFLGTFRFVAPTSCLCLFAYLSWKNSPNISTAHCVSMKNSYSTCDDVRRRWPLMSADSAGGSRKREHYVFWQTIAFMIRGNQDASENLTHLNLDLCVPSELCCYVTSTTV